MSSFTSAKKHEIRHFHVVVVQRQQRNVQKSVMHLQSCWFANLLLLFCRSRCRWRRCCRRRCLSSLFLDGNTLSAILHQRHSTTVSSSVNTLQILSELSRVLLDRQKCILTGAIKFLSVRQSLGSQNLFDITRVSALFSRKLQMQFEADSSLPTFSKFTILGFLCLRNIAYPAEGNVKN